MSEKGPRQHLKSHDRLAQPKTTLGSVYPCRNSDRHGRAHTQHQILTAAPTSHAAGAGNGGSRPKSTAGAPQSAIKLPWVTSICRCDRSTSQPPRPVQNTLPRMPSALEFVKDPVPLSLRFLKSLLKSLRNVGVCGMQVCAPRNVLPPALLKHINNIYSKQHRLGEKVMLQ